MARALRRPRLTAALVAVVAASTLLHWLAGRRIGGLWILPDEAVYADRMLAFWRHGHVPSPHGYSFLYPLVAGFPFALGPDEGYALLKVVQALLVSLAAVPVALYARRVMAPRWALVASVLAVASPLLLYSGLVMTEALFYPLAAWTLLQMARAVETGSRRDQIYALVLIAACALTRTQAVVLLPVFVAAVLVEAGFARRADGLRRFWAIGALLVAGAITVLVRPGVVGAYAVALRGGYPVHGALALGTEHLALAVLTSAILPVAALLALTVEGVRGRLADAATRSLVATALAAFVLIPVQVGTFAARFAPHLLQRDLAALPPVLLLVFALWLDRGAPRPLGTRVGVAFVLAALLLLMPWNTLVSPAALPDSFSLAVFEHVSVSPADAVAIATPILLLAFVAAPRRARAVLPAIVLAALVATSVVGSNAVAARAGVVQANLVGPVRNWIDRTADGPVAYLYDGESYWTAVWQQGFWNRRIGTVLATSPVPGPLAQTAVKVPPSGLLPMHEGWVVATDTHQFVGTPAARLTPPDVDVPGLTLWRLDPPARISLVTTGVQPNGDMLAPARIHVFGCAGGRLQLTLLPKATRDLRILVDGKLVVNANVAGQDVWHGLVPAPARTPTGACTYTIVPQSLLGSTVIAFQRA